MELYDREIIAQNCDNKNIYNNLISIIKQSTNEYYNMRMVLGLKCV